MGLTGALMGWILSFALAVSIGVLLVLRKLAAQASRSRIAQLELDAARQAAWLQTQIDRLTADNESLAKFTQVRDADSESRRILADAEAASVSARIEIDALRAATESTLETLRIEAQQQVSALLTDGRRANADARQKAERTIEDANRRAASLVQQAEFRAEEIAGDAYRALHEAQSIQQSAAAMRNVIEGYGDLYLKPTYSLLDQLAQDYEFESAAQELKRARANSVSMVTSGRAAECDYVEKNRRETAIRFVIDAFNGKVDTIL
jgi:vacuolar-type H+-ATPase subunit H